MKLIAKIYLLFFIVNALIYFPFLLDPVLIPRFCLLTVFLILISALLLSKKSLPPIELNLLGMLVLAFPFFYLINLDNAIYKGEALYFFLKELMLALFFLATAYFLKNKLLSKNELLKSILIFTMMVAGVAIVQLIIHVWTGEFSIDNMIFLCSTAANKNLLSMLLYFGIVSALLLYFEEKKIIQLIAISVFTVLIALLQTRSVWLATLVLIVFIAPWKLLTGNQTTSAVKKNKVAVIFILLLLIAAIIFVGYYNRREISSPRTLSMRFEMWKNTWAMISDHFFSGVGGGNWQIHFPAYGLQNFDRRIADGYMNYQRPHNDFLWVFSETGAGGFLIFISIFIIGLRSLYRFAAYDVHSSESSTVRTLAGCIAGFLIISFFDFPFERLEHREIALIFLALSSQYQTGLTFSIGNIRLRKILYALIPFLIACFYIGLQKMNGEYHLRKMIDAKKYSRWEQVITESKKSKKYFYKLDSFSMPVSWYAGVAYFNLGNNKLAKENFEDAYHIHPFNIHVLNNLAGCYEKESDHINAIHFYKEALRISPGFEESRLNLSAAYFNSGDIINAYESIQKVPSTSEHPNYPVYKSAIENKFNELTLKTNK